MADAQYPVGRFNIRNFKDFIFSRWSPYYESMNHTKNVKNKKQWIKPQMKEVRISMESTAYSSEVYR